MQIVFKFVYTHVFKSVEVYSLAKSVCTEKMHNKGKHHPSIL